MLGERTVSVIVATSWKGRREERQFKKKLREIVKGLLNNARVFRLCPARAGGIRDLLSRGVT